MILQVTNQIQSQVFENGSENLNRMAQHNTMSYSFSFRAHINPMLPEKLVIVGSLAPFKLQSSDIFILLTTYNDNPTLSSGM